MVNYFYALYEADNDTFIAEFDTANETAEFMAGRVYRNLASRIRKIKELDDNIFFVHKYKNSKGPIIEFHVYKFIDDRDNVPDNVDWLGNPPNIDNWLKERK